MIETALSISLVCLAIHALFWDGMIFYRIGRIIQEIIVIVLTVITGISDFTEEDIVKASEWILKPVFGCLICMASFWTLIAFYIFHFNTYPLWQLMLTVCALNVLMDSVVYFLRGMKG